jgi:hypothetical protein
VQEQLGEVNVYKPAIGAEGGPYTNSTFDWATGADEVATAEDLGLPGKQLTPGVHNESVSQETVDTLAAAGTTKIQDNTTHPAPAGETANLVDADTHIKPGDDESFYKDPADLVFGAGQYSDGNTAVGMGPK